MPRKPKKKEFICKFYFTSWSHINLGFHICLDLPNIEIHLPFSFIRVGIKRPPQKAILRAIWMDKDELKDIK